MVHITMTYYFSKEGGHVNPFKRRGDRHTEPDCEPISTVRLSIAIFAFSGCFLGGTFALLPKGGPP